MSLFQEYLSISYAYQPAMIHAKLLQLVLYNPPQHQKKKKTFFEVIILLLILSFLLPSTHDLSFQLVCLGWSWVDGCPSHLAAAKRQEAIR